MRRARRPAARFLGSLIDGRGVIRFRTLGGFELLRTGDHQISGLLTHPKCVALLTYLAAARPLGSHRRDKLFALFWPEFDTHRARDSLRQAIYVIRERLGRDAIRNRGAADVTLAAEAWWCDVVAFEEAVRAGDEELALALYRGDFLDGFFVHGVPEFEAWVASERARLARAYTRVLEQRAARLEAGGDPLEAVDGWSRLVERDPLNGRLVLRLMAALDASGDRAGALAAARRHARLLAAELDATPDPAVVRLAERLRLQS